VDYNSTSHLFHTGRFISAVLAHNVLCTPSANPMRFAFHLDRIKPKKLHDEQATPKLIDIRRRHMDKKERQAVALKKQNRKRLSR